MPPDGSELPPRPEVRDEGAEGCLALFALGGAAMSACLASAGEIAERTVLPPGLDFPGETFMAIAGILAVGSVVIYSIGRAWDKKAN